MEKAAQMGLNRTGIDMSPMDSKQMISGAQPYPASPTNGHDHHSIERTYIHEADAIGSVPVPGTVKGALKSVMNKMTGRNPEMLINKLGERLAYERSGVPIYESFLTKCEAAMTEGKTPVKLPLDQIRQFRDQEAEHFHLLKECLQQLGADPTAQTPDADVSGIASMGLMKVIMDPRTTVGQSPEAMLSIELTDNAAWELLIKLAADMGMDDMVSRFQQALHQEQVHLQEIRAWYEKTILTQATVGGQAAASRHH